MMNRKHSKRKEFTFEEFKKEFYTKETKESPRNKSRFYELGVRMARESLVESEPERPK